MQYTGKVIHKGAIEYIGDKQTPKQTLVIEEITDRQYPGSIAVDVWGDKTQYSEAVHEGEKITVHLNSRSREYNGRYYNSISAWRIEKNNDPISNHDMDEDLPF